MRCIISLLKFYRSPLLLFHMVFHFVCANMVMDWGMVGLIHVSPSASVPLLSLSLCQCHRHGIQPAAAFSPSNYKTWFCKNQKPNTQERYVRLWMHIKIYIYSGVYYKSNQRRHRTKSKEYYTNIVYACMRSVLLQGSLPFVVNSLPLCGENIFLLLYSATR